MMGIGAHSPSCQHAAANGLDQIRHIRSKAVIEASMDKSPQFPFRHLPPELRLLIWQQYCPDLTGQPRVLDFHMSLTHFHDGLQWYPTGRMFNGIYQGRELAYNTREIRNMLAVHQESRAWALHAVPHSLSIYLYDGSDEVAIIRFNKARDVVLISEVTDSLYAKDLDNLDNVDRYKLWQDTASDSLLGFHDQVVNLAIQARDFWLTRGGVITIEPWVQVFSAIKTLFLASDYISQEEDWRWYTSESINQYMLEDPLNDLDPKHDNPCNVVCWPDLIRHPTFAEASIPRPFSDSARIVKVLKERNVDIWPMNFIKMGQQGFILG
ncbi:hypothetical protein QQS21_011304 [Conoideocrella luteorostrata]|uniref:2EXR domain-containing protein n=1 Tax=Conoideocrella luteorostrata TaxID=1105319 RepID=A0AAJ0FNI2_9HYPO|nr:hypothetical protein QQS21_011304 [Conoideocrella luteorostrata]